MSSAIKLGIPQKNLICSISTYESLEIFKYLEKLHGQNQPIKPELLKASGKGLQPKLSIFDRVQIIKISLIFVEGNSTNAVLFDQLLKELKDHLNALKTEEFIQLCSLLKFLEIAKAKNPPNQILVNFLESLKILLSDHLKVNNPLIETLCQTLNTNPLEDTAVSSNILEMLIDLGIINKNTGVLKSAFEKLKIRRENQCGSALKSNFNLLRFYCQHLALKKLYQKKDFYHQDVFYKTLSSKVQWAANDLQLSQIDLMTSSLVQARIRDISVLRTLARRFIKLLPSLKGDDYKTIIRILENYAKLNVQHPLLFDLFYNFIITKNIKPNSKDTLTVLHSTAIFGINGSSSKVKTSVIAKCLSPYVVLSTNSDDLLKLEIMKLFMNCMFPKLSNLMPKADKQPKQLKGSVSPIQKSVSDFLISHGIENECEAFIDEYPYPLDIVIRKERTIIEIDGPHHKDISGKACLGKDALKNFLLSKQWKIIRLNAKKITKTKLIKLKDSIAK